MDTLSDSTLVRDSEERLRRLGVPAFAGSGPTWNHGRIMPLLWMLAFELGVATFVSEDVPVRALLAAAPFVALVAFVARPISASALGIKTTWSGWLLIPLTVGPVIGFYILRDTLIPLRAEDSVWSLPVVWSDTAVILVSLYAAAILLLARSRPLSARQSRLLWVILLIIVASHLSFGVQFPMEIELGEEWVDVPAVPLLVTVGVLALSLWVRRVRAAGATVRVPYGPSGPAAVLVVLYGLTHGLLSYFYSVIFFLNIVASLFLLAWAIRRRLTSTRRERAGMDMASMAGEKVRKLIDEPDLRYWIPIFVLAYPLLSLALGPRTMSTMFDHRVSVGVEILALVIFNLAYVAFVWFLVGFGLDQITIWAAAEAWKKRGETMKRMAGATPLLLIVVIFFALTAETWQIAASLSIARLGALLALLFGLVVVLVIGWSAALISRKLRFAEWADVDGELAACVNEREFGDLPQRLRTVLRDHPCARSSGRRLRVMAWLNALLVLLVYQSFTLGAVLVSLFLAFLVLVLLAVPSAVAAEWVFGDGQAGRKAELVKVAFDDSMWASPWLRVSIFLALFSLLYFAAQSLADEEKRIQYFRGIDRAMRRRIAIHLCYRHLHHTQEFGAVPVMSQRDGKEREDGVRSGLTGTGRPLA